VQYNVHIPSFLLFDCCSIGLAQQPQIQVSCHHIHCRQLVIKANVYFVLQERLVYLLFVLGELTFYTSLLLRDFVSTYYAHLCLFFLSLLRKRQFYKIVFAAVS